MNEEIFEIIKGNDYQVASNIICEKYNLLPFQGTIIIDLYMRFIELENLLKECGMNKIDKKDDILYKLKNGEYQSNEMVYSMAVTYCKKKLLNKEERLTFLINECNLEENSAKNFIDIYDNVRRYEDQMLSEELDTHMLDARMDSMIDEIAKNMIDNQRNYKKM